MNTTADLPSFENPPVIEVVCGIQFKALERLLVPHFGELWERFKPDYDGCQEAPPIMPAIEQFVGLEAVEVELPTEPPLPRIWLVHKDENGLIQVQRDRFLHNWKKIRPQDQYPRYGYVKDLFEQHLATFEKFLAELNLGSLAVRQYEMTYVNHISQGEGWETLSDLASVFPDFAWRDRPERFLKVPQGRNLRLTFPVPDKSARLHATIRNAVRPDDQRPLVLFELTVRGIGTDTSRQAMWRWFDVAREWIVRGFADLTGDEIQKKVWRRTR